MSRSLASEESLKSSDGTVPEPDINVQFVQPFLSVVAVAKCVMVVGANFFGGTNQGRIFFYEIVLFFARTGITIY